MIPERVALSALWTKINSMEMDLIDFSEKVRNWFDEKYVNDVEVYAVLLKRTRKVNNNDKSTTLFSTTTFSSN